MRNTSIYFLKIWFVGSVSCKMNLRDVGMDEWENQ